MKIAPNTTTTGLHLFLKSALPPAYTYIHILVTIIVR